MSPFQPEQELLFCVDRNSIMCKLVVCAPTSPPSHYSSFFLEPHSYVQYFGLYSFCNFLPLLKMQGFSLQSFPLLCSAPGWFCVAIALQELRFLLDVQKFSVGSFSINGLTSPKWETLIWVLNSLCTSLSYLHWILCAPLSPICTKFQCAKCYQFWWIPANSYHMHQKFKLAYQGPSNSLIVFSFWFYFCECKWIISMIIFQVLYFSWVVGLGTMKGLVIMVDGGLVHRKVPWVELKFL
jgi:hypothetical protein